MSVSTIHRLAEKTANQIAAGEVVQRPASVVKELMENAVDAGATIVKLYIKNGGCSFIQVEDNGKGMNQADAILCWERHATSKIQSAEDLYALRSLGFRGEALASIASVSEVEMQTRMTEEEQGVLVRINGGQIEDQEIVACPRGTIITVKNLFFNLPARKNFLKSISVETKHVMEEFQRMALAYPSIAMELYNQDKEVFKLKSSQLRERISELLNIKDEQLIECKEDTEIVRISGFIGSPNASKRRRGMQFFFANGRYIRDNYLNHAVKAAYAELIEDKAYPFYALFLEVDPSKIDVNIHPTKHEVKFEDGQHVYSLLQSVVKKALGQHFNLPLEGQLGLHSNYDSNRSPQSFKVQSPNPRYNPFEPSKKRVATEWEKLDELLSENILPQEQSQKYFEQLNDQAKIDGPLFQLAKTYLVHEMNGELWLIHQHRAHERILYERYINAQVNRSHTQTLLFPRSLELNPTDLVLVHELMDEINALGFDISDFGQNSIIINGLPTELSKEDGADVLYQIIDDYKENLQALKSDKKEALIRASAKNSAIKAGTALQEAQMRQLVSDLLHCKTNNSTPSGAPIIVKFDADALARFFHE